MPVKYPDVSVCIVTFNQVGYIGRCLESVVSQQFGGKLEVLVGDDGSSDGTREVILEYASRLPGIIIPIFREKNLGPSGNYHDLIKRTCGKFVAHLDGDDYWVAGKLERQLSVLAQHAEDTVAVVSNAWVVDRADRPLGLFCSPVQNEIDLDFLIEGGNFICHGTLMYRSSAKENVLSVLPPFIDFQLLIRLAVLGKIRFVDEALAVYRWNTATSMRSTANSLVVDNYWRAILDARDHGASKKAIASCTTNFLSQVFAICASQNDAASARAWIRRVKSEALATRTSPILRGLMKAPLLAFKHFKRKRSASLLQALCVFYRR